MLVGFLATYSCWFFTPQNIGNFCRSSPFPRIPSLLFDCISPWLISPTWRSVERIELATPMVRWWRLGLRCPQLRTRLWRTPWQTCWLESPGHTPTWGQWLECLLASTAADVAATLLTTAREFTQATTASSRGDADTEDFAALKIPCSDENRHKQKGCQGGKRGLHNITGHCCWLTSAVQCVTHVPG